MGPGHASTRSKVAAVASLLLLNGCGLGTHLSEVASYLDPPPLTPVSVTVQPFSATAGMARMLRQGLQDALFSAQAGNRDRTLVALKTIKATLDNTPALATDALSAKGIEEMITQLDNSSIGAMALAERLQAALGSVPPADAPAS